MVTQTDEPRYDFDALWGELTQTKVIYPEYAEREDENGNEQPAPEKAVESYVQAPFTEAHITICEGDQRGGKTTTAVARIRDAFDKDGVRVYCRDVLKIKCEVVNYNRRSRKGKIKYRGGLRELTIPQGYKLHSPKKIFSNIHLYGIPYVYIPSFEYALAWMMQGIIVNCWLLLDEAYVGMNAREGMRELGRGFASTYMQFAKMQLDVIIITPMARQIDWIARTIPTEHINCSYNKTTRKITLKIKKQGVRGERTVEYDATQYWRNFRTNERVVR